MFEVTLPRWLLPAWLHLLLRLLLGLLLGCRLLLDGPRFLLDGPLLLLLWLAGCRLLQDGALDILLACRLLHQELSLQSLLEARWLHPFLCTPSLEEHTSQCCHVSVTEQCLHLVTSISRGRWLDVGGDSLVGHVAPVVNCEPVGLACDLVVSVDGLQRAGFRRADNICGLACGHNILER